MTSGGELPAPRLSWPLPSGLRLSALDKGAGGGLGSECPSPPCPRNPVTLTRTVTQSLRSLPESLSSTASSVSTESATAPVQEVGSGADEVSTQCTAHVG